MNRVQLHGRIVSDPDIRYTPQGTAVAKFTIACDKKGLSKEKKAELRAAGKPTANFPRCIAWGKQAETIANYFKKGDPIIITEAELETGSYKNNNGDTVYTTTVKVENFEFVMGNSRSGGGSESNDDFSFGSYNPDDFRAIEDDEDIPF